MSEATRNASGGLSFSSLLTIVFITLKLTHYIDWSWWWVLSPVWISFCVFLVVAILVFAWVFCVTVAREPRR